MQGNQQLELQWVLETITVTGNQSNGREILITLMFFKSRMPLIVEHTIAFQKNQQTMTCHPL